MGRRKKTDATVEIERKVLPFFCKVVDEDKGIVDEIFAVFGNIDYGGDIIETGAFAKTLNESRLAGLKRIKVLDSHNLDSISHVIGVPLSIEEVGRDGLPAEVRSRFPDATGGVKATTQYLLDTPEGLGAFNRIKAGAVTERSFGFNIVQSKHEKVKAVKGDDGYRLDPDGEEITIRRLKEVRLMEYSVVIFGMNPATATVGVKARKGIKAVTSYQNLPLASRDRAWDASAAEKRVREWAGGSTPDDVDFEKYRKAFFYYDPENDDTFGGYKLGYADVDDGKLVAIPKAVFAVAGALEGARGGVTIPDDDKDAIKGQVGKYYKKMASEFDDEDIVPPWDKSVNLTDIVGRITTAFYETFGPTNRELCIREVFTDYVIAAEGYMSGASCYLIPFTMSDEGVAFAPSVDWVAGSYQFTPNADALEDGTTVEDDEEYALEGKAGRMISAANAAKLTAAMDTIRSILEAAGLTGDDDSDDDEDDEESDKGAPVRAASSPGTNGAGPGHTPPTPQELAAKRINLQIKLTELDNERIS